MNLTKSDRDFLDDLYEQSKLFDMEVDWEFPGELIPKQINTTPQWLTNYRSMMNDSDKHYDHVTQGFDGKEGEK